MAHKGGARLTRHYTDRQRDALLKAVLVDGISQREAERRAIDGTLEPGLAPFGRPRFIYSLIRRGRADFEAGNDEALDFGHASELRRLYLLALAKSRQLDTSADVAEIARHAKAVGEAHKALRAHATTPKTKPKPQASAREATNHGAEPQQAEDVLAGLVSIAGATPNTANTDDNADGGERGPVASVAR